MTEEMTKAVSDIAKLLIRNINDGDYSMLMENFAVLFYMLDNGKIPSTSQELASACDDLKAKLA